MSGGRSDEPFDGCVGAAFLWEYLVDVRLDWRIRLHHSGLNLTLHRALQHILGHYKVLTKSVKNNVD